MKQIYIESRTQSQNHQNIGDGLSVEFRFILKLKPTGRSLCKGPPGRTRIPVTACCLNPGNLEAPFPQLVERSINTTINYIYFNKNNNQLSTNI